MRLKNPDWLFHRLTVSGEADSMARFRAAAAGAGTIPWRLDADQLEDAMFHLLVAPERRTLSVAGCRILARQLREAAVHRHTLAMARVGPSRACPFDLHRLVPVPDAILALGPDDPAADDWLWANWGTTQALRHVVEAADHGEPVAGEQLHLCFWSADWTPWRALARMAALWPTLGFQVRPDYRQ